MQKVNIITQLLSFFMLAVIVNLLNIKALVLMLMFLIAILSLNRNRQFLRSMKRFKWFLLVLIVIFSFNTPGEHLAEWPFSISPTYEGMIAGFTQTLRIASMLAALSLILDLNSRQQIISGFYFIFSPLKYLGLEVERFAARLWLTLHYVELQRDHDASRDLFGRLKEMTYLQQSPIGEHVSIKFKIPQFGGIDYAVITLLIIIVVLKVVL